MKRWLILTAAIFLTGLIGCLWVLKSPDTDRVEIIQDGALLYSMDLSVQGNGTIDVAYVGRTNVIQIQDGKIRMLDADCPDQTCVHMGG